MRVTNWNGRPKSEPLDREIARAAIDYIEAWMRQVPEHAKIALENVGIARKEGPVMANDGRSFAD